MAWALTEVEQLDGLRARVRFESTDWPGWRVSVLSGVSLDLAGPRPYVESLTVASSDRKPAPQALFDSLSVGFLYSAAMDAAEELDLETIDDRRPLPAGKPRPNVNNDAWYREFGQTVNAWLALGMTVTAIDAEVAQRRGVGPDAVKKWRRDAKRIAARDAEQRPIAVASCAACGGPILPGAVGALHDPESDEWRLYHPAGCYQTWHERMVVTPDGEVVPL